MVVERCKGEEVGGVECGGGKCGGELEKWGIARVIVR